LTLGRRSALRTALLAALPVALAAAWLAFLSPWPEVRAQRRAGFSFFADVYAWFDGPTGGRVVRVSPGDGIYYQPCIRPDGREVVFAGSAAGPPRLWAVDLDSLERRALTGGDSAAVQPVYSWDGAQIAFCSDRDSGRRPMSVDRLGPGGQPNVPEHFELYVMGADGSDLRRVTAGPASAWRPTFSPDGSALAFSSREDGRQALYEVRIPAPGEPPAGRRRIAGTENTHRPWFAADGRSLLFHTTGSGRHRVHRIPREGGTPVALASDTFERTHGSFVDPGGELLLVHALREGTYGIWELPLEPTAEGVWGAPRKLEPPGFSEAYHATRARDGTLAFDLPREATTWREVEWRLRR